MLTALRKLPLFVQAVAFIVLPAGGALAQGGPLGSPRMGQMLIIQKGCGSCHMIPGITGADGLVGPPLIHFGRRIFIAGLLRNTPQNLAAWVFDPQRFVPGNAMPATGLTPDQAADVAAYLETIQ